MARLPKQAPLPFSGHDRTVLRGMRKQVAGVKIGRGPGRPRKSGSISHRERPGLARDSALHVTVKLRRGLPRLRGRKPANAISAAFRKYARGEGFRLVHFSVQYDHIHFLIEADSKPRLSAAMQKLTISIARRLNVLWQHVGSVFKQRYHAHILKTPTEVRNAIAYVLGNGTKHGNVKRGEADPFSSATKFDGYTRLPRIGAPPAIELSSLAGARSWKFSTAWRYRGLIDPKEAGSWSGVGEAQGAS